MKRFSTGGRLGRLTAALAALLAIAAVWSDAAIAAPVDVSSDHVALIAYHRYVAALVAGTIAGNRTAGQYGSAVGSQCAGVLAPLISLPKASVSQSALTAFGEEVGGDLAIAFDTEAVAPSARLSATLAHLRWSLRRTRHTVASMLSALKGSLQVRRSNLCADARALVAQPTAEPAGTRAFLAGYLPTASIAKRRLAPFLAMLARYQPPADSAIVSSIGSLVTQFSQTSRQAENALGSSLLKSLGLS